MILNHFNIYTGPSVTKTPFECSRLNLVSLTTFHVNAKTGEGIGNLKISLELMETVRADLSAVEQ